jgi:hypothetical protein
MRVFLVVLVQLAVAVSALAICLSPPLLSRNLWIPFRREKVSEAQFFFPKRKREFSFEHGAKRRRRKSVQPWPDGRGFKWRAPSAFADGSSPFKPQTALLSVSRAVGIDETRRSRARARLPCEHQKNGYPKGGRCEASRASLVYGPFSAAMMRAWRLAGS